EFPAKATGNDCYTAFPGKNDWYETVKLNYGIDPANGSKHFDPIPDTWLKMLHILRYWASKNIDGFRCDMAHMVPIEFWHWAIPQVKDTYPDIIFIAEIYDVGLYRPYLFEGGFDYLYDKVNLYDTLRGIECHNVSAAQLTSCWQTVEGISGRMLNFLENHDEQRYASTEYAGIAESVLPSLVIISTMSTGAVMVYSGQELGERAEDSEGFSGKDGRSTIFDYWSIEKIRRWINHGHPDDMKLTDSERELKKLYEKVLTLVNHEDAIKNGLFFDLMYVNYDNPEFNPHRQFAYIRSNKKESILIVVNFDKEDSRLAINIPEHAFSFLELPQAKVRATNLLDGTKVNIGLNPNEPVRIDVKAHGAALLKFRHPKSRHKSQKKAENEPREKKK
ncbi:MAG: alpha-amylase, partial [Muribaculaceae bacterium]|nr:alpha-amylase [Muribaculaceae bacterium]